jgi:transposase
LREAFENPNVVTHRLILLLTFLNFLDINLPMYIKKVKKSNKNSSKIYEYLHLVENIRTEKGPRQRLILNLGSLDIPADQYKELANCIESMLTGQKELFSSDPVIEKIAAKASNKIRSKLTDRDKEKIESATERQEAVPVYENIDILSLQASELRSLGPEYVCHSTWNELRFNDVLLSSGVSKHVLPLLEALIIGRLTSPGSERHTHKWIEDLSAIWELTGKPLKYSLSSLYRAGRTLFDCKNNLETHLARREKELFSLTERMCFFDLTNTYFEGQATENSKAKRGRSKEKRSDCKLVTLALVIDEHGFPKYSKLYPGNQGESKTLKEIIESLIEANPTLVASRTVVIDAGIANAENIEYLKEKKFHYIVVNKGKKEFSTDDTDQMETIKETGTYTLEVKRREKNGEALLLCHSTAREGKDYGIRNRQESIFTERLHYFHDGLSRKGRTKSYPKIIEMIGRLRGKYPKASKLYDIEVMPESGTQKNIKAKAILWKKRDQYKDINKFDGCYVLKTDRLDLSDKEIWKTYIMLTRIESAFRSMKSHLGLRPIFHQNEKNADAHIFISVLAYHILHTIEYKLHRHGEKRSWASIRESLSSHQRLTIEYNVKKQTKTVRQHMRVCSRPEPDHKKIYKMLGLNEEPLPRKLFNAK